MEAKIINFAPTVEILYINPYKFWINQLNFKHGVRKSCYWDTIAPPKHDSNQAAAPEAVVGGYLQQ